MRIRATVRLMRSVSFWPKFQAIFVFCAATTACAPGTLRTQPQMHDDAGMNDADMGALTDMGMTATDMHIPDVDLGGADLGPADLGVLDLGESDFGVFDLGVSDLGAVDLGHLDLGVPDLGAPDLGAPDLGAHDSGPRDLGATDLGAPDLGAPDLGAPADMGAVMDSAVDMNMSSGCGGAIDCPAMDCMVASCSAHMCHYAPAAAGTTCGDASNHCLTSTCDGAGTCNSAPVVCTAPPVVTVPTSCSGTFMAPLGGSCNTTCNPGSGCIYGMTAIPCPPPSTTLPQKYAYQVVLRNYMASLAQSDFDVPTGDITWSSSYTLTNDELYRLWLATHYDNYEGGLPHYRMLHDVPSSAYTLSTIEASSPPHVLVGTQGVDDVAAFFYRNWNYAGNPYYGSNAVTRRAFVLVAADMMLMDAHLAAHGPDNLDVASGCLIDYGYTASAIKNDPAIDACTRAAFSVGLRRMFDQFEPLNVGNGNGDMLISQVEGYAFMADALGDPATVNRAKNKAETQLAAICDPAGFCWHQGGGYDPYYEGWTESHVAAGALFSHWDVLENAAREIYTLRSTTQFPQPSITAADGSSQTKLCLGPTAFAPATAWSDCVNGGDFAMERVEAMAMLNDDAVYGASNGIPGYFSFPSVSQMRTDIGSGNGLMRAVPWGRDEGLSGAALTQLPPWEERHYPRGMSNAVVFYQPGTYTHLASLAMSSPELQKMPVMRSADYIHVLGASDSAHQPQVFTAKFGGSNPFAMVVHTGTIDTLTDGSGFGGGALTDFWTRDQGAAIYGWNIGRNYTPSSSTVLWYTWSNWTLWPAHAISGRSGSTIFSSARLNTPTLSYDTGTPNEVTIAVSGDLKNPPASQATLGGHVNYARQFHLSSAGVDITTTLTPSGTAPTIDELYETLPLFSYFYQYDNTMEPASSASQITYRLASASTFAAFTNGVEVANVQAVRVTRFGHTVEIDFGVPHPMQIVLANDPSIMPTAVARTIPYVETLRVRLVSGSAPLTTTSIAYTISRVN